MHLQTENGDAPSQSGAKSEYFGNIQALLSEVQCAYNKMLHRPNVEVYQTQDSSVTQRQRPRDTDSTALSTDSPARIYWHHLDTFRING